MINVFISNINFNPLLLLNKHHDLPFVLEPDKFNIVDRVKYADVIPDVTWQDKPGLRMEDKIKFLGPDFKNQWILRMMHTHVVEQTDLSFFNTREKESWLPYTKNIIIVDTNLKNTEEVTYDFLWNRQKAYFVDYDKFDLSNRLWTRDASKKMYALRPIPNFKLGVPNDMKKFLMPGRTTVESGAVRINFRLRLKEIVKAVDDSFYSDWNPDNPMLLWPEERIRNSQKELFENFAGWWPIANEYYINSFVSVYVETITHTNSSISNVITEKTLDPLIKGHFILPFGYAGLIEDIKNFGFKLPTWIDYSYDKILNAEERFCAYLKSFLKLRSLDLSKFIEYHNRDRIEILEYNRNLFFTKPYDSLYEKLKLKLKQKGVITINER